MIHHLTFDVRRYTMGKELEFWACLGWNPTGLRRRSRKQPPINWLVCGGERTAVELIEVDTLLVPTTGHVCIELGQRRYEIATQMLARFQHEFQPHHSWKEHGFALSPTGHTVEIAAHLQRAKAGPPLEEES